MSNTSISMLTNKTNNCKIKMLTNMLSKKKSKKNKNFLIKSKRLSQNVLNTPLQMKKNNKYQILKYLMNKISSKKLIKILKFPNKKSV